ncbi:TetR/AcrR family transcriptional regulator [Paraburkholderia sp. ZP32-5]|uniref:TetR/AcrR family transcriptional regulator n=1 Tax=Paraburkholderia sp. ZP32-5 TaxID=2883245 RepID=UPI001F386785|nr:TetR/AcrR family transcriptional regulator [Paraburkholderia sp. ZP32-5]
MPASTARQAILEAATTLLSSQTYESVSIDEIANRAGFHKMAIYRSFGSREGLAIACANWLCHEERGKLERAILPYEGDPSAQLKALFASLCANRLTDPSHGCRLQLLAGRFPDPDHPVRAVIARQKRECRRWLADLLTDAGIAGSASRAADMLILMWDGIVFNLHGTSESRRMAAMLSDLVDEMLRPDAADATLR